MIYMECTRENSHKIENQLRNPVVIVTYICISPPVPIRNPHNCNVTAPNINLKTSHLV